MESWVSRKNIERLRAQLSTAVDEYERQLLANLLSEEEANLERLTRAEIAARREKPQAR
jgi:hypothetical protein